MDISRLRQQSNQFIANMDGWIELAVMSNADSLVGLNIKQMLSSKLANDGAITPKYSKAYAKRKGFSDPNLRLKGDFQNDMDISVTKNKYSITSLDYKTPFLTKRYTEKIFGIAPSNQSEAQRLNDEKLASLYLKWLER